MKNEKLFIDMPDEITIKNEINSTVERGIHKKESFYLYLKNMYRQLGFNCLFHDLGEIIFTFILVLTLLILIGLAGIYKMDIKVGSLYVFIMTVSPILYLIASLLAFISSKEKGTYDLEMTCKYNIYQLAAFRMLIFSVMCILSNIVLVCIIASAYMQIELLRAVMIAIMSLFLFSSIFLYTILNLHLKFTKYIVLIGCLLINLGLYKFNIMLYIKFLTLTPIYIYLIVTVVCIFIYIKKLKELIKFAPMKGVL